MTSYPAIFTKTEDGYLIEIPDLEILTQGTDMENAIEMAKDAISITIVSLEDDFKKDVPIPSSAENIDVSKGTFTKFGKSFVSLVGVDIDEYRKMLINNNF